MVGSRFVIVESVPSPLVIVRIKDQSFVHFPYADIAATQNNIQKFSKYWQLACIQVPYLFYE